MILDQYADFLIEIDPSLADPILKEAYEASKFLNGESNPKLFLDYKILQ